MLHIYRATAHEIAAALAYLHSQDLLHGDLTGGNILLASSDADERGFCAKVADFGLSRTLGSEPVDTGTYGTVTHMPPELLTTGKIVAVIVKCDLLSLWQRVSCPSANQRSFVCIAPVLYLECHGLWTLACIEQSPTCPLSCSLPVRCHQRPSL